jgi:SAM-dependent methyltransferase
MTQTKDDQTQPNQAQDQRPAQSDDAALKAKHAAMWAMGDYPAVATEVIAPLGPILVGAAGIRPGERVVDIAAGSGNAAIPAARTGADVVATDLTPELLETGRQAAEAAGVTLRWRVGDAEAMPCDDGEHDVAISCVGIMFAPHHQRAADELVRVVRPGGRIALLSWTPAGFIGQMFATMKPYAPPPPPGAQPPPLWGDEAHVRALLGDRVTDVTTETRTIAVPQFADGASFRDYFKRTYGPTIAVYRSLADDPARAAELDEALAAHGDRYVGDGPMEWEYLLLTARRA